MSNGEEDSSSARLGCGNIIALGFVAVAWMLLTFLTFARARVVGWPGALRDQGAIALGLVSLVILALVVMFRNEIIQGGTVTCPRCGSEATPGGYSVWQLLAVICLFPIGLLALLVGREETECPDCHHLWRA